MIASCKTNSLYVSLGSYDLRIVFTSIGSATPWINSSITLSNCPTFVGYDDNSHKQTSPAGRSPSGSPLVNSLLVTLTPSTAVTDTTRGLMKIDQPEADTASGIELQLAYGETSSPTIWSFTRAKTL